MSLRPVTAVSDSSIPAGRNDIVILKIFEFILISLNFNTDGCFYGLAALIHVLDFELSPLSCLGGSVVEHHALH